MNSQSGTPGKSGGGATETEKMHRRRVIGASLVVALLVISGLGTWLAFSLSAPSNTAAPTSSPAPAPAPSFSNTPTAPELRGLIVVGASTDTGEEIVSMRPPGTQRQVLTTGSLDSQPELSPDGRTIAFLRCTTAADCDAPGASNVWMMGFDGSDPRAVTTCTGTPCTGAGAPSFSPDGQWLAFAYGQVESDGLHQGIFLARPDGSGLRRLTDVGEGKPPDGSPHFSPDGSTIVFDREADNGTHRFMTVRADGTGLAELGISANASDAVWSPTGNRIAFSLAVKEGDATIYDVATAPAAGGTLTILSQNTADYQASYPSYSPDGRWVVFSQRGVEGGCDLKIVPSTGGAETVVSGEGSCLNGADWGRFYSAG
ncbi:PD40 domain-containing protein [Glaciihabitans sp. dw_435]|uniref:TolB family protein n=1 Tax=Glaciihabitans sp. dw_435 TaxID=2720081 RepID=UPI001BD4722F|nr:PD40 domain-containing protein [Glaciihabitans sp. dw_435]